MCLEIIIITHDRLENEVYKPRIVRKLVRIHRELQELGSYLINRTGLGRSGLLVKRLSN